MSKVRKLTIEDILFFATVWVYFALNAKYLNFSGSHILRWVFPGLLIFITIIKCNFVIAKPPAIIILFTLAVIPSILNSDYASEAFIKYLSFLFVAYGLYIFFMQTYDLYRLKKYFHLMVAVVIIYHIFNFIFTVLGINTDSGRSLGITTNANTLGVYSNIAYMAILYLYAQSNSIPKKFLCVLLLFSTIFTSLASGSRTAFVVLCINLFVSGFVLFSKNRWIYFTICIGFVYLVLSGKLQGLNITALDRLMEEGTSRDELWIPAISLWKKNKWVGVGYTVSKYYNPLRYGMAFHNSYISYLVETGICGVIFLALAMFEIFIKVCNKIILLLQNKVEYGSEFLIASLMEFGLAIAAWSESFLFAVGSTEGFTFWVLIAWLLAYMKQSQGLVKG